MRHFQAALLALTLTTSSVLVYPQPASATGWLLIRRDPIPSAWKWTVFKWAMAGVGGTAFINWVGYAWWTNEIGPKFLFLFQWVAILSDPVEVMNFQPASPEQAQKIGLTPEEQSSYNASLARLNLAAEELNQRLEILLHETPKPEFSVVQTAWLASARSFQVPEPALSAAQKIANSAAREMALQSEAKPR